MTAIWSGIKKSLTCSPEHSRQCCCFACAKLVHPEGKSTPRSGNWTLPCVPWTQVILCFRNLGSFVWMDDQPKKETFGSSGRKELEVLSWGPFFQYLLASPTSKPNLRKSAAVHPASHPQLSKDHYSTGGMSRCVRPSSWCALGEWLECGTASKNRRQQWRSPK